MFVFSDNLNYNGKWKKQEWDLNRVGFWETEEDCEQEGRDIKHVGRETIKRTKYRPVIDWK